MHALLTNDYKNMQNILKLTGKFSAVNGQH